VRRPYSHLLYPLFLAFFLVPLAVLVLYAMAPGWRWPDVLPASLSGRAFGFLASRSGIIARHMGASLVYSLATTGLTLLLCLAPAHHLARHTFRGKAVLEGVLLAPALVPSMTFSMGIHYAFIRLGLADTMPGVVLALSVFSYPYMLRALITGFQSFGPEYEQCARHLGAGWWMRLTQVELPLLVPAMVAGGSVVFLVAFSEYFLVFLIGGGVVPSYTGYLFPFLGDADRSVASALTLLFLLVPVSLFLLVELLVTRAYRRRGMY